jgi:hypothetical protein
MGALAGKVTFLKKITSSIKVRPFHPLISVASPLVKDFENPPLGKATKMRE